MDVNLITVAQRPQGLLYLALLRQRSSLPTKCIRTRNYFQRQLLLPLWDYMATLSKIDSNTPVTPDVIKVVNSRLS